MSALKGVEQISLSPEWTEYLESICSNESIVDSESNSQDSKTGKGTYYFVGQKDAYRAAIALAVAKGLQTSATPAVGRKSKWQTPTIYDEEMESFVYLTNVVPPEGIHIHHHLMALAEAGLAFMKSVTDNDEDLWDHLIANG